MTLVSQRGEVPLPGTSGMDRSPDQSRAESRSSSESYPCGATLGPVCLENIISGARDGGRRGPHRWSTGRQQDSSLHVARGTAAGQPLPGGARDGGRTARHVGRRQDSSSQLARGSATGRALPVIAAAPVSLPAAAEPEGRARSGRGVPCECELQWDKELTRD